MTRRFFAGIFASLLALSASFTAFLAAVFVIPADIRNRVRMSLWDYAQKLGRDLAARAASFRELYLARSPGPALSFA